MLKLKVGKCSLYFPHLNNYVRMRRTALLRKQPPFKVWRQWEVWVSSGFEEHNFWMDPRGIYLEDGNERKGSQSNGKLNPEEVGTSTEQGWVKDLMEKNTFPS